MLALSLGCSAMLAPDALAAKHKPKPKPKPVALLAHRSCQRLLTTSDFPGAASEGPLAGGAFQSGEASSTAGSYFTTCEFDPPEATEEHPKPEGGGLDELAVYDRFLYEHDHNLTGSFPWPAGLPKRPAPIPFTSHAYLGYDEGIGYGLEQVRNDVFYFYTKSPSVLSLLEDVALELCVKCK
jgi:hypothetical protein